MIKIKDFIFNENNIKHISQDVNDILRIYYDYDDVVSVPEATFDDIEWNYSCRNKVQPDYESRIRQLEAKIERLKERNNKLKEENEHIFANVNDDELLRSNAMNYAELSQLKERIGKALKYIEEHKRNVYSDFGEDIVFGEIEGIKELLRILKGEENE